ncbi:MAG TPA: hypothetical protein VKB51_07270 [bacterium]|nr:hypothetical protein [bacterium]
MNIGKRWRWWALVLGGGLLVLALAGCRRGERPVAGPAPGALTLEQPYAAQSLGAGGSAEYRLYAPQRGAYLIVVSDNPTPIGLTITHPKKTCHVVGNGSCELVSGADENYTFQISADAAQAHPAAVLALRFTVTVTHSEGKGYYEGQVGQPQPLRMGQPHPGAVGVYESSYYSFVPTHSGPQTIALTGTQSDLLWRLFDAPDYDVILQECDTQAGAVDEVCPSIPLQAGVRYYLKVEEKSGVPGTFRLALRGA